MPSQDQGRPLVRAVMSFARHVDYVRLRGFSNADRMSQSSALLPLAKGRFYVIDNCVNGCSRPKLPFRYDAANARFGGAGQKRT